MLTFGLTSRVPVLVVEGWDDGRLVELAGGRLGPAVLVEAVLSVVVFLSVAVLVEGGVGRLAVAAAEPPAGAVAGRVLAPPTGLVTPVAGCHNRSMMEGKIKRRSKQKKKK